MKASINLLVNQCFFVDPLGADRKIAENDMKEAIEFELRLVDFSSDEMIRRDPERSNNPYQLWQLSNAFPFVLF